ncbi:MAG: hypothetical protein C0418_05025 [Coriobacteriaceae bacterium]|nr:hypothetical protein [Coriobacteriaceae bacterium]
MTRGTALGVAAAVSVIAIGIAYLSVCPAGPQSTPAVYIQHVGASDKPIPPVVVFAKQPTPAEFDEVLGSDEVVGTAMVSISVDALGRIITDCKPLLERSADTDSRAYGTFRITVVETGGKLAKTLPGEAAGAMFSEMRRSSGADSQELQTVLEGLQRRLGVSSE